MKKLYFFLPALVALSAAAADSPRRPMSANPIAPASQAAASPRARAAEIWRPAAEIQYSYTNGKWVKDLTITNTYDDLGQIIRTVETNADGETSVTTLEYDQNGKVINRTVANLVDGTETPTKITTYTYDPIVTNFQTSMLQKTWINSKWVENGQKHIVTRNDQGNVTAVDLYVPFNGEDDLIEKTRITYAENIASTFTHEALKYDGVNFFWQTGAEAKNIQWENTDGQILGDFTDLVIGANRVRRADMYFNGEPDGYRIVTYPHPDKPDFVALETGFDETEIYERHTYTVTDEYGSFIEVIERPFADFTLEYIGKYDSHGNPTLYEEYDTENGEKYLATGEKYEYTYDTETGCVLEMIFYGLDPDTDYTEYIPYYKSVYSQFIDAASAPAVALPADGPARFFNLQGIEIPNPAPGAVYIRIQGSTTSKVLLR